MLTTRPRDEAGNVGLGCLILVVLFVVLAGCMGIFASGGSDCYATPGAQEGSAQAQRDIERCLE